MKRLLVCLMVIAFAGCKKEINALNNELQGTWELTKAFSGWGGLSEYEPGNGNTIQFSGNSFTQKIITQDSTYTIQGNFSIYQGKPCEMAEETTLIKFSDEGIPNTLTIESDQLTIGDTECITDGAISFYRRISQ